MNFNMMDVQTITSSDLNGEWVPATNGMTDRKEVSVNENTITFMAMDFNTGNIQPKTVRFELQRVNYMLHDCECYKIKLEEGAYSGLEFFCHVEEVGGKAIPVISMMTMEYDGRGLIVVASFVRRADRELIPQDFRSQMYRTCNEKPSIPMCNPGYIGGKGEFIKI